MDVNAAITKHRHLCPYCEGHWECFNAECLDDAEVPCPACESDVEWQTQD